MVLRVTQMQSVLFETTPVAPGYQKLTPPRRPVVVDQHSYVGAHLVALRGAEVGHIEPH